MSRFNNSTREMPEMNTSSLPDLIFTILFFFMMVTSMREETVKVKVTKPKGTQIEKLARKSATSYIYIGQPLDISQGTASRIQVNDKFIEPSEIRGFVVSDQAQMSNSDKAFYTVSLKVDANTQMDKVTQVKEALRRANALKIVYSSDKAQE